MKRLASDAERMLLALAGPGDGPSAEIDIDRLILDTEPPSGHDHVGCTWKDSGGVKNSSRPSS